MNRFSTYRQNRLVIGLLSALFFTSPPFESNPQGCGMIRVIEKKEDNLQTLNINKKN